jgi:hypothetical protein
MRAPLHTIACATLFLGIASILTHGYAADPQVSDRLCSPDLNIDKEKLAAYMLQKYPVSTAYLSAGAQSAPLQSNRALLHWLLAKRAAARTAAANCDSGDACNMDHIATDMQNMLDGKNDSLKPSAKTDPVRFFDTPDAGFAVHCATADATPALSAPALLATAAPVPASASTPASAPPPANPGPPPVRSWTDDIRLRGNPDQLSIDRTDTSGYSSVDKAQLNFADDSVAGSKTKDVVGYVGYAWLQSSFGNSGSTYQAIPYAGFRQNRVTVAAAGGSAVTTSRTSDVGLLSSFHFAYAGSADADDVNVRPDYLIDSDGSRLLTVNFSYTPLRKGRLNDLIPFPSIGMSVKPILIGQSRNGTYINRGDPSVAGIHQDFVRLGAQAGFALVSNNPRIPMDFVATYTGLKAFVGAQSIHYAKVGVTYNLNQHVGLGLNYTNGLVPDTGVREKKWNLGIASKF